MPPKNQFNNHDFKSYAKMVSWSHPDSLLQDWPLRYPLKQLQTVRASLNITQISPDNPLDNLRHKQTHPDIVKHPKTPLSHRHGIVHLDRKLKTLQVGLNTFKGHKVYVILTSFHFHWIGSERSFRKDPVKERSSVTWPQHGSAAQCGKPAWAVRCGRPWENLVAETEAGCLATTSAS